MSYEKYALFVSFGSLVTSIIGVLYNKNALKVQKAQYDNDQIDMINKLHQPYLETYLQTRSTIIKLLKQLSEMINESWNDIYYGSIKEYINEHDSSGIEFNEQCHAIAIKICDKLKNKCHTEYLIRQTQLYFDQDEITINNKMAEGRNM